jgi:hypothetical protein
VNIYERFDCTVPNLRGAWREIQVRMFDDADPENGRLQPMNAMVFDGLAVHQNLDGYPRQVYSVTHVGTGRSIKHCDDLLGALWLVSQFQALGFDLIEAKGNSEKMRSIKRVLLDFECLPDRGELGHIW